MLLGLAIAVLLALIFQLNALRVRRSAAFDLAGSGVIHLKAWIVVETGPGGPVRLVGEVLMLARRGARAIRAGRLFQIRTPRPRHRPRAHDPARPGDAREIRWKPQTCQAAWSTGPPPWQVPRAAALNKIQPECARQRWRAFAHLAHGELADWPYSSCSGTEATAVGRSPPATGLGAGGPLRAAK